MPCMGNGSPAWILRGRGGHQGREALFGEKLTRLKLGDLMDMIDQIHAQTRAKNGVE